MTLQRGLPRVVVLLLAVSVPASGFAWFMLARPADTAESSFEAPESPQPPGPPGTLIAVPGNGQVLLAWTPPETDGGSPILGYTVFAGAIYPSLLVARASMGNTLFFTDIGLTNGVVYHYRVVAYNLMGEGTPSNRSSASPGDFDAALFGVPRFGLAPFRVEFVLSAFDPAISTLGTSEWNFGDGHVGTVPADTSRTPKTHNLSHMYEAPGTYTVATRFGTEGRLFPGPTLPIVVLPPLALDAAASATMGTTPLTVSFRASAGGGLPSLVLHWKFGGEFVNGTDHLEHIFGEPGTFQVTVSVRDGAGNVAAEEFWIHVTPALDVLGLFLDYRWTFVGLIAAGGCGFVLGVLLSGKSHELLRRIRERMGRSRIAPGKDRFP